ncbi:CENP-Q, a CENPA-CAD centromere complex subunit domain-containing protein [Ophiocordyceps camponoti-floridani]|uniref:CENP-Q, a CENPA-CAD centromere complex subunit domain-containing protein n=1 Tax=Ophiocordyceps camponoti-floridani TaxID=2030778 RepID=A0A8H4VC51_9HYPO|nr:CENP-Q, a CENPA-CAD centromere complex subunit domain-containing protein [Ophiocordyceps camponoti-floridani]
MMTDAELDRDWKPNGRRPQSTVARSFSDELMDIFRIDNSLTDLDQKVDQRRQNVGKNNQELADIEARIREMEDRLRRSQQQNRASLQSLPVSTPQKKADGQPQAPVSSKSSWSRPGTTRPGAPGSGRLPPTPGASEDGNGLEE